MSYVPPHLRNGALPRPLSSSNNSNRPNPPPDYNDKPPSPGPRFSRPSPAAPPAKNPDPASGRRAVNGFSTPESVFPKWQPSERVLRMTPEQIEDVRLRLNVDVTIPPDTAPAPAPIESFTDMCLNPSIMKDVAFHDYTRPTSIQAQAMPVALSGRDLLGCAETGSGKTAAFAIPMIQHCLAQPPVRQGDGPLALVLAPTRELAQQIEKEVKAFSRSLDSFRTAIVVGGTNIAEQRSELRAGVYIVVATPGRFIDHLQQGNSSLSRISFVVLDEADRMLDMGFEPQIREEYLNKPVQIKVGKVSCPTMNVSQVLEKVSESEKVDRLLSLLVEESSRAENSGQAFPLTIVFVERKTRCDEVAEALIAEGLPAVSLHGGRSQTEREAALHDFRNGSSNILVATDVASRGLDVTGVAHVVNLDLPKTMEDYVHRIGRTGRAGTIGHSTSFYTDRDMIRKGISDVESGNSMSFATGKVARRKEREVAAAQREVRLGISKQSIAVGPTSISVEDKYRYMLTSANMRKEGAADDAWDD